MGKLRQWTILTALGCLVVLAAGWLLVVTPQQKNAASARASRDTAQQNVDALRAKYSVLLSEKAHLPEQQGQLLKFAQLMPDNPSLPSLIRSLSAAADTAGVDLTTLSPQAPTLLLSAISAPAAVAKPGGGTSSATTGPSLVLAPVGPQVAAIPLSLTVTGLYFQMARFLDAIEGLKRAFQVTGLNITPMTGSASSTTASAPFALPGSGPAPAADTKLPGTLTVQLTGKVFMIAGSSVPTVTTLPGVTPAK